MVKKKINLDAVDLTKFVLSIMIVAIHINPIGHYRAYVMPFLRMAVPLFFLISSYFVFRKLSKATSLDDSFAVLGRFIKRNLQLYAFWFIVFLVPMIKYRSWFDQGLLFGLFKLVNSFLFDSTFVASWYIMATVIGVMIVFALSRFVPNRVVLLITFPAFVICCLMSNYACLPTVELHMDALNYAFGGSYNSFWASLFWVAIGKTIADNLQSRNHFSAPLLIGCLALGIAMLAAEQWFITLHSWSAASDSYFSLPLACIPAFLLVIRTKCSIPGVRFFRAASAITYCFHANFNVVLNQIGFSLPGWQVFAAALLISWLLTVLIMRVEKINVLRFLRYSH